MYGLDRLPGKTGNATSLYNNDNNKDDDKDQETGKCSAQSNNYCGFVITIACNTTHLSNVLRKLLLLQFHCVLIGTGSNSIIILC